MAVTELTEENIDHAIENHEIVFIYFWAPDTPRCEEFKGMVAAAAETHPDVLFAFCNALEETTLAKMFQLKAVPTVTVFRFQAVVYAQATTLPPGNIDDLLGRVRDLDMAEVNRRVAQQQSAMENTQELPAKV